MSLPMQKATYRAIAVGVGFGTSSNGNTQIAIQCQIVDDSDDLNGQTIAWLGHFTAATTARTIESLQHFGWLGDDLSELEDLDAAGAAKLLPQSVELVCDVEEYNGNEQLRVKWVNKPGAGKFSFKEPLKGASLKAFAAQMKATVRGARGAAGARPAANGSKPASGGQSRHPNAPGNDDAPPF